MSKKFKKGFGEGEDFDGEFDSAYGDLPSEKKENGEGKKSDFFARCYESHPVIELGTGKLYGGSCSYPRIDNADVYVGLDSWMKYKTPRYPWKAIHGGPEEVLFSIGDQQAPKDTENFILMIGWLKDKLTSGKTVHVGCMGGHGRTGMVLAALVKEMTGEKDAIAWLREHYCKKAVESKSQVDFLVDYFGITQAPALKHGGHWGGSTTWGGTHKEPANSQSALPTYSESWGNFIPGTAMPRSKGPRDQEKPKKISVKPLLSSPISIYKSIDKR